MYTVKLKLKGIPPFSADLCFFLFWWFNSLVILFFYFFRQPVETFSSTGPGPGMSHQYQNYHQRWQTRNWCAFRGVRYINLLLYFFCYNYCLCVISLFAIKYELKSFVPNLLFYFVFCFLFCMYVKIFVSEVSNLIREWKHDHQLQLFTIEMEALLSR